MSSSKDSYEEYGSQRDTNIASTRIQDSITLDFDDGAIKVFFQIIRLEKQVFVYVGLVSATLESMSIAMPTSQVRECIQF